MLNFLTCYLNLIALYFLCVFIIWRGKYGKKRKNKSKIKRPRKLRDLIKKSAKETFINKYFRKRRISGNMIKIAYN